MSSEALIIVLYVVLYGRRYQINAKTELAVRYDNMSPLENHHYAVAAQILGNTENNIFCNVNQDKQRYIHDVSPTRRPVLLCLQGQNQIPQNELG